MTDRSKLRIDEWIELHEWQKEVGRRRRQSVEFTVKANRRNSAIGVTGTGNEVKTGESEARTKREKKADGANKGGRGKRGRTVRGEREGKEEDTGSRARWSGIMRESSSRTFELSRSLCLREKVSWSIWTALVPLSACLTGRQREDQSVVVGSGPALWIVCPRLASVGRQHCPLPTAHCLRCVRLPPRAILHLFIIIVPIARLPLTGQCTAPPLRPLSVLRS